MVVCKKTPEVYLVFEHEVDYFSFSNHINRSSFLIHQIKITKKNIEKKKKEKSQK